MLLHPPPAVQFKLPGVEDATETPPPWGAAAHHAKKGPTAQYFGSFKSPPHPDDAMTAALNSDEVTRMHHAEDFLISLILVAIVLFAGAMATFFWKKYRAIHLSLRAPSTYEYSQLSQCEREGADLSEIADDLGISINTSTDEEDLEPACPATISVTASYITTISNNNSITTNNNDAAGKCHGNQHHLADDDLLDMPVTPDAALPAHLQVPLQPDATPADASRTTVVPMFVDSDEELLQ